MNEQISKGSRVELLVGKEDVYDKAVAGAQAIVTDTREEDGFDMVYVEWDTDHCRFTGEDDCWTFASHFKEVEPLDLFSVIENPDEFLEKMFKRADEEADGDQEAVEHFMKAIQSALNVLAESDGFVVVATKMEQDPDNPERNILMPHVYSAFLGDKPMMLVEAQVIQLAAMSHQDLSMSILAQYQEESKDEEDDEEDGDEEPV